MSEFLKMVLVVRMDLKMGTGKIAAQCAHAATKTVVKNDMRSTNKNLIKSWISSGAAKIVVGVKNEDEFCDVISKAKKLGLLVSDVRDAGLTQVEIGARTVAAIGPADGKLVDRITGRFKLL